MNTTNTVKPTVKPTVHLCDIETVIDFLLKNPIINTQYSLMFSQYFPELKDPFNKLVDELNDTERIFRENMMDSVYWHDIGNNKKELYFDMKKYYLHLNKILDLYHTEKVFIMFIVDENSLTDSGYQELIGCSTLSVHQNGFNSMLTDVCVRKKHQGQGFGKILTNLSIDLGDKLSDTSHVSSILLTVDKNKEIAKKCYEKCGFTVINDYGKDYMMEYNFK
jgi:GNAT superfamily N-acetyltransferase